MPENLSQELFAENVSLFFSPHLVVPMIQVFLRMGKNRRRGLRIQGGSTMNCMKDGIFGNQRVMSRMMGGKA
jgi:hypothetical protein